MIKHTKTKRIQHSNKPVQYVLTQCYKTLGGNCKQAPDHSFCDFTCTMEEFFFLDNCYRILAKKYQILRNNYDTDNDQLPKVFMDNFQLGFSRTEPKPVGLSSICYKLGRAYRVSCEKFLEGK